MSPFLQSGTEREEVIAILNKCFVHAKQGTDLQIYSVFASDDLKGKAAQRTVS